MTSIILLIIPTIAIAAIATLVEENSKTSTSAKASASAKVLLKNNALCINI